MVDPKIHTKDAVNALLKTPGGKEIVDKLEKEGHQIRGELKK